MIRLITGIIIAMSAVDAPIDAPLTLVIAAGAAGLIIAGFGARKLTKGN
jgi:threonine synthase